MALTVVHPHGEGLVCRREDVNVAVEVEVRDYDVSKVNLVAALDELAERRRLDASPGVHLGAGRERRGMGRRRRDRREHRQHNRRQPKQPFTHRLHHTAPASTLFEAQKILWPIDQMLVTIQHRVRELTKSESVSRKTDVTPGVLRGLPIDE